MKKWIPRYSTRNGVLFVQEATLNVKYGELVMTHNDEEFVIPTAELHCVIIGRNVSIDDLAVKFITGSQCTILYVDGLAGMKAVSTTAQWDGRCDNLIRQAEIVSDENLKRAAARRLLALRFDEEVPNSYTTLNQMRGWEGSRMKKMYAREMKAAGIEWEGRNNSIPWSHQTDINRAISVSNSMLYGLSHAGLMSFGMSPALGIIHCGSGSSMVYDVADSLKLKFSIPTAIAMIQEEISETQFRAFIYSSYSKNNLFPAVIEVLQLVLQ